MDRPRIRWLWRAVVDALFTIVAIVGLWQYFGSGVLGGAYLLALAIALAIVFNAFYRTASPTTEQAAPSSAAVAPGPSGTASVAPTSNIKFGRAPPRRSGRPCERRTHAVEPLGHESVRLDVRIGERLRGRLSESNGNRDFSWGILDSDNTMKAILDREHTARMGGQGQSDYSVEFFVEAEPPLTLELVVGERDLPRQILVDLSRV
jgi:hypothetical protein